MTGNTVYFGHRRNGTTVVWRINESRERSQLPARLDLRNHSPTGFEWGYGGSGPEQLALAILADASRDALRAVRLYQFFKWRVVSKFPRDEFIFSRNQVIEAVQHIEDERKADAK